MSKAIDYKKMVKDINKLVNNDWCAEMEMRYKMPNSAPITQKDAHDILDCLLNVFMISHQTTCTAHGEYRVEPKASQTHPEETIKK